MKMLWLGTVKIRFSQETKEKIKVAIKAIEEVLDSKDVKSVETSYHEYPSDDQESKKKEETK